MAFGIPGLNQKELIDQAMRHNRGMQSIDDDLKKVAAAFNENFKLLFKRLNEIEAKLDKVKVVEQKPYKPIKDNL
jgi:hypothetical protein